MNLTTTKILAIVVATSILTSVSTNLLMRKVAPSAPGTATAAAKPGLDPEKRPQFPLPNPQSLAELESQLANRQSLKDTTDEITIDLKPYINSKLTDPLADLPEQKDHTLDSLPTGVHIYGGVPFDVEGIIQLNSKSVKTGVKLWPLEVAGIAIGHPCKKLHLLQGAFNMGRPQGHPIIAKLILHYADGSQAQLPLVGGINTLASVGQTISPQEDLLKAPQTELAWLGSNPYLKKNGPGESIHLYRTTLDNPYPDIPVTAIDYRSNMANPGPFMVGLTIE